MTIYTKQKDFLTLFISSQNKLSHFDWEDNAKAVNMHYGKSDYVASHVDAI